MRSLYLFIGLFLFYHHLVSQTVSDVEKEYIPSQVNLTWEGFMEDFSKQTGYYFSYASEILSKNSVIHFSKTRYSFQEALTHVFLYSDLTHNIHKNVIIIKKANHYSITGAILDASDRSPLAFATLTVESINKGAIADENGKFNMVLKEGNYTLKFFCFGYCPIYKNISVSQDITAQNIQLSSMILELDPVVIGNENPIKGIHNIDYFIKNRYFQNLSGKDVCFSSLPGEVKFADGRSEKGYIKILPSGFIKKIKFKNLNDQEAYYPADSIQSFIQVRSESKNNLIDHINSFQFKHKDSSEKNRYGIFQKKSDTSGIFSFNDYYADSLNTTELTKKDFEDFVSLSMGNINPFYFNYESVDLKKEKKVFLAKIINGRISVYNNPRKINMEKLNQLFAENISFSTMSLLPFGNIPPIIPPFLRSKKTTTRYYRRESKIIAEKKSFYIQKDTQWLKIKSTNYRKYFLTLFGDCKELIEFTEDRKKLKKIKNVFKLIIIYNYLSYQQES